MRMDPDRGRRPRAHDDDTATPPTWDDLRARSSPWFPPALPTTIVVPHPDDEALLFGGLVAFQRARGIDVIVIAVTDGEAAYPEVDPTSLARTRRREQRQSLALLGVGPGFVHRLGIPDGEVERHLDRVADAVSAAGAPLVLAPWEHDHHSDHEACGRAAQMGARDCGAVVWSGLFWAWHHSDPRLVDSRQLMHLPLSAALRTARRAALGAHRSQLSRSNGNPILAPPLLAPVTWDREYVVAPARPSWPQAVSA